MRRSRKYSRPVRPLNAAAAMGYTSYETAPDGTEYKVRHLPAAKKVYVCPGCHGTISLGEPHEVVWTEDTIWGSQFGIDSRRHWHTSCWRHRGLR